MTWAPDKLLDPAIPSFAKQCAPLQRWYARAPDKLLGGTHLGCVRVFHSVSNAHDHASVSLDLWYNLPGNRDTADTAGETYFMPAFRVL